MRLTRNIWLIWSSTLVAPPRRLTTTPAPILREKSPSFPMATYPARWMTAETTALIHRAGYVAIGNDGLFSRKIGAGVVVNRRGGATSVLDQINHMFLMSRMIVPGSTYWNFGVGREKGEVAGDEEALRNMRDLGDTIAWLIPRLRA